MRGAIIAVVRTALVALLTFALGFAAARWSALDDAPVPGDETTRTDAPSRTVPLSAPLSLNAAAPPPAPPTDATAAKPVDEKPVEEKPAEAFLRSPYGSVGRAVREHLARAYRARTGSDMPDADLDIAARYARDSVGNAPEAYARTFAERAALRTKVGTLEDPFEIVLQGRTRSRLEVKATAHAEEASRGASTRLSATPLDVSTPPAPDEPDARYVRAGLVPTGKALVLEEIEVAAVPVAASRRNASVEVRFPDLSGITVPCRGGRTHVVHAGRTVLWYADLYGYEDRIAAEFSSCAGSVAFRGKVVDPASLEGARPEPFRAVSWDGEGLLGDRPVRIQIVADHGGGNPRTVSLDGVANHRIDSTSPSPLWDEHVDLSRLRTSSAWVENAGVVPPGKAYEVRRIDWRVRFAPGQRYSKGTFEIRTAGAPSLVRVPEDSWDSDPRDSTRLERSGRWDGALRVRPGDEERFTVTASYFSVSDTTIYGAMVDDPR